MSSFIDTMKQRLPLPSGNTLTKRIGHIDGLRGIAIILILCFHAFPCFPRGYFGVDVFLVISGYFLFRNFWEPYTEFDFKIYALKKATRLFPCTAVVAVCTMLATLLLFHYEIVVDTSKSAIASILGVSNIYYDFNRSDYFAASSIFNPLIHTWYIGVIVQVYLIAGILQLVCKRKSIAFKFALLLCLLLVSLVVSYMPLWLDCIDKLHDLKSTYYWTWGHLWAVLAGAFAFLLPGMESSPRTKSALSIVAPLSICILGLQFCTTGPRSTCIMEVYTVLATVACIRYCDTGMSCRMLSGKLMATIGKYSFSLYLVHWPIISFFAISSVQWESCAFLKASALLLICIATWSLYHMVEKRRGTLWQMGFSWATCAAVCILLICTNGMGDMVHATANAVRPSLYHDTGEAVSIQRGVLYETLPAFRQTTHPAGSASMQSVFEEIPLLYQIGDPTKEPSFILIGDSHAEVLYPGFDRLARDTGWSGAYLHSYVLPFSHYFSVGAPYQRWDAEKEEQLIGYLRVNENIKTVFIANFWACRFNSNYYDSVTGKKVDVSKEPEKDFLKLRNFIYRVNGAGKTVVVFTDFPIVYSKALLGKNLLHHIRMSIIEGREIDTEAVSTNREQYNRENETANAYISRLEAEGACIVLHPEDAMFKDGRYCCFREGKVYYQDSWHIALEESVAVMEYLKTALRKLIDEGSSAEHGNAPAVQPASPST